MNSRQHRYRRFYRNSALVFLLIAAAVALLLWYKQGPETVESVTPAVEVAVQPMQKVRPTPPAISFTEASEARGLVFNHNSGAQGHKWLPETMGGGIAVLDVENDGDLDLYFSNGTGWPGAASTSGGLFINDGQAHFTENTATAGLADAFYGTGVAVADVNRDGFQDLFVAAVGDNRLYLNQGDGTFLVSKQALDCDATGWSTSSGFFDYDRDGDDDLVVLNYIQWTPEIDAQVNYQIEGIGKAYGPPTNFASTRLCLFANEDGLFRDVSAEVGLNTEQLAEKSKALALAFWDLNQDGWLDIVVANDTVANQVFMSQGDGGFVEQGGVSGLAFDASGKSTGAMGIDLAHYQNDDRLAVAIGNFAHESTSFYVTRNGSFYIDESMLTGIGAPSRAVLTFGVFFFDYDLDGRQDFFQTNGHVENLIQQVESAQSYRQANQLFWHCGHDCQPNYENLDGAGDLLNEALVGRAAAYADLDQDGDLDVIVGQVDGPVRLYLNEQQTNHHWLTLRLTTSDHRSLVGAQIEVTTNAGTQRFVYSQTKSYQTQVQPWVSVGLGDANQAQLKITEIDGTTHTKSIDAVNQFVDWTL